MRKKNHNNNKETNMRELFSNQNVEDNFPNEEICVKEVSDDKRQDKVIDFLKFLNVKKRTGEEIESYINNYIKDLYSHKDFRHSYFRISAYLQESRPKNIEEDLKESKPLDYNLELIVNDIIVKDEYKIIRPKIIKLVDHCRLELSRFTYFENVFWRSEKAKAEFQDFQRNFRKLDKRRKLTERQMHLIRQELSSAKSEYITILSILAAVILAGMGGFTILGNIANSLKYLSDYRFLFITSFLGLILFNVIFMLIYMIARLINKNIYTHCDDASEGDCLFGKCNKKCWGVTRIRKRLPYVFWINIVFLITAGVGFYFELQK